MVYWLLKDFIAGLMILIAEDALRADRLVFAPGAYLFGVDEQGDVLDDEFKGFGHWFAQRPCDSS